MWPLQDRGGMQALAADIPPGACIQDAVRMHGVYTQFIPGSSKSTRIELNATHYLSTVCQNWARPYIKATSCQSWITQRNAKMCLAKNDRTDFTLTLAPMHVQLSIQYSTNLPQARIVFFDSCWAPSCEFLWHIPAPRVIATPSLYPNTTDNCELNVVQSWCQGGVKKLCSWDGPPYVLLTRGLDDDNVIGKHACDEWRECCIAQARTARGGYNRGGKSCIGERTHGPF